MLLHNQHYYLMTYSEYWERMVFHRLDRMTDMKQTDKPAKKLQSIPGYEKGIDYKDLTSDRPYLYTDKADDDRCPAKIFGLRQRKKAT